VPRVAAELQAGVGKLSDGLNVEITL
jgi:hypothetical protein